MTYSGFERIPVLRQDDAGVTVMAEKGSSSSPTPFWKTQQLATDLMIWLRPSLSRLPSPLHKAGQGPAAFAYLCPGPEL